MQTATLIGEVISIGDEMTSGARLDTNTQWLSRRLGEIGVDVKFHTTVGDDLQQNVDVFRIAARRADIILCTGGLGPTRDDLTRQALSAALDRPLELRDASLDHIRALFAKRKREMPERNKIQAMFPVGSSEIFNPQGTAPGIDATFDRGELAASRIFCLPGVPAEMKRMYADTVAARIGEHAGHCGFIRHAVMKFFGVGESDMEQRLGDMIDRDRSPRVGITVSAATISLRITAVADSEADCQAMIQDARVDIMERVGDLYFGDGESFELQHAVRETLSERNESLLTIELGHSAPLAAWFSELGKSPCNRGGLSFDDLDDLAAFSASEPSSASRELLRRSGADWTLLVDSYPSLDCPPGEPFPVAEVKLTVLASSGEAFSTTSRLGGHPSIVHARIGKAALAWFRKVLSGRHAAAAPS